MERIFYIHFEENNCKVSMAFPTLKRAQNFCEKVLSRGGEAVLFQRVGLCIYDPKHSKIVKRYPETAKAWIDFTN